MQSEIIKGSIDLDKDIKEIMIQKQQIKSIKLESRINSKKALWIAKEGFSRLPVYSNNIIIGVLLIKSLIGLDLGTQGSLLSDLVADKRVILWKPMFCSPDTKIVTMLKRFKNGRSHLAIVTDNPS